MEELVKIIEEMEIVFAYDHFAEGESPNPPFICYLLLGSNNFAADGRVYHKINEVRIELYTDFKDTSLEEVWIEEEKLYEVRAAVDWPNQ